MENKEIVRRLLLNRDRYPDEIQVSVDLFEMARIIEDEDKDFAHKLNKDIRQHIERAVVRNAKKGDITTSEDFFMLNKRALLFDARTDFDAFLQYIEYDRNPDNRFYLPRRRTLLPIVEAFQAVHDGELDLLTVSQPKRTGKTTLGIAFGAFRAGNAPEGSSLFCGAKNGLAETFMKGFWTILNPEGEYLFYDVFPNAPFIKKSEEENNIHLAKVKIFATIQCRSIHGDITGTTEATPDGVLYMDDMVENEEEARSIERLQKRYDEIKGDLLGRRIEGCPIIAQGTHYSIHDPLRRLQDDADMVEWRSRFMRIPALSFDTDESNFEIEIGGKKRFTTEYYRTERQLLGENSIQWESQFQQEPFEARGRLYDPDNLRRYFELPKEEPDAILAVCDPKETGRDHAVLPVAYVYGEDYYIEDCVCNNGNITLVDELMINILMTHKVQKCQFESNSAGWRTAEKIQKEIEKRGGITHITSKRTSQNKETKIIVNSPWVLKHCLFKDTSKVDRGSEYGEMLRLLSSWTMSVKNTTDDVPDAMAMLAEFAQSMNLTKVVLGTRPW